MEWIVFLIAVAIAGYVISLHGESETPFGIAGKLGLLAGLSVIVLFLGPLLLMIVVYTAGPMTFLIGIPALMMLVVSILARRKKNVDPPDNQSV